MKVIGEANNRNQGGGAYCAMLTQSKSIILSLNCILDDTTRLSRSVNRQTLFICALSYLYLFFIFFRCKMQPIEPLCRSVCLYTVSQEKIENMMEWCFIFIYIYILDTKTSSRRCHCRIFLNLINDNYDRGAYYFSEKQTIIGKYGPPFIPKFNHCITSFGGDSVCSCLLIRLKYSLIDIQSTNQNPLTIIINRSQSW